MTLLEEIQAKCTPQEIAQGHEAVAAIVNLGRTKIAQKLGGIGLVLETLGPVDGAALLDQLEALSTTNSAVKWAFVLINRGELDFGSPATRAMIDMLVSEPAQSLLKAVAEVPDHVSAQQVSDALR